MEATLTAPTNGKHLTLAEQIEQKKQSLELHRLQMEERVLLKQQQLLGFAESKQSRDLLSQLTESTDGVLASSAWGQFVDPRESFPDAAFQDPSLSFISLPSDRMHGRQRPFWININTLGYFRQASRILCQTNTQAKGVLKNLTNYQIGTGFKYKAAPKAEVDGKSDVVKKLVSLTQDVINDFLGEADPTTKMTPWNWREREAFRRVRRDGEAFIRLFFRAGGKTDVRFVEPELIRDPANATLESGWSYGIQHLITTGEDGQRIEDVETIVQYHVTDSADASKGEEVKAANIIHIKNVDEDSTVKRGLPDFIYDTRSAFERAAKLQRNLSEGASLQAAIAWVEEFENATKASVTSYADERRDMTTTDPLTGRTISTEKTQPGTIARVPKTKKFVQPPWNQGAGAQQAIVQGDLRQGLSGFCAPEYFTSDASNADYSSTKEAGAPFVKCSETDQTYFRGFFLKIIWKAVRWAVHCGKLPPEVLNVVMIQVEAPVILHKEPLAQAQCDQILVTLGAKDRDTVSMEWGYDPEVVQASNAAYAEHNPMPGGMGGLMGGEGPDGQGGGAPPNPFERMLKESKDASGHEHKGKGEGGGQFAAGGGSTPQRAEHGDRAKAAQATAQKAKEEGLTAVKTDLKKTATAYKAHEEKLLDTIENELGLDENDPDLDSIQALQDIPGKFQDASTIGERKQLLDEVFDLMDGLDTSGENGKALKAIRGLAFDAKDEIHRYARYRQEMHAIQHGRLMESREVDAIHFLELLESKDASGHEHASDGRFGTTAGEHGGSGEASADVQAIHKNLTKRYADLKQPHVFGDDAIKDIREIDPTGRTEAVAKLARDIVASDLPQGEHAVIASGQYFLGAGSNEKTASIMSASAKSGDDHTIEVMFQPKKNGVRVTDETGAGVLITDDMTDDQKAYKIYRVAGIRPPKEMRDRMKGGIKESKDASGHEHASDGRFGTTTGSHGGGGEYESPQLKRNREIVAKLNNPQPKKLSKQQEKNKKINDLHKKLASMDKEELHALAVKHGIDPAKYPSDFNLRREIIVKMDANQEVKHPSEPLTVAQTQQDLKTIINSQYADPSKKTQDIADARERIEMADGLHRTGKEFTYDELVSAGYSLSNAAKVYGHPVSGTVKESRDSSGHEHASDGRFGATAGQHGSGDNPAAKSKGKLSAAAAKFNAAADKIPVVGKVKQSVQALMKGIHGKLEKRYGTKAATAIMTSGSLGGYGVAGAAFLLTGTPGIPVVNDLISIAAHTAIAEIGMQLHRAGRKLMAESAEQDQGEEFVTELKAGLLGIAKELGSDLEGNEQVKELVEQIKAEWAKLQA